MDTHSLFALSPLDGRYRSVTKPLQDYFSESALIKYRLTLEIKYLLALSEIKIVRPLSAKENGILKEIINSVELTRLKEIESKTHHDVKAVEYYLREKLELTSLKDVIPFIHFGLTSEDINNLAYRLMIQDAQDVSLLPTLSSVLIKLSNLIKQYHDLPMLARTHGQPAVPTTLGKEFSVFTQRVLSQLTSLQSIKLTGKLNGAVGNFNALSFVHPKINWLKFSQNFISTLNLKPQLYSTQINPPDDIVELLHCYHRLNSILIGLCQDTWRYISDDWLVQKGKSNHVGSSTMPQKINPIEFENAEGNLTLANGLIETLARKLPISRLQRDLSDSTVTRNLGVVFGHCLVAYNSLNRGLATLSANKPKINSDLHANFSILSEALQTTLRAQGRPDAYESVAKNFRGQAMSQQNWQHLTQSVSPKLATLSPSSYTGLSSKLALHVVKNITKYLAGASTHERTT